MDSNALHPVDNIAAEDVRSELDRVIASLSFRSSQRLSKFLQYLVEKWLAGSHDLKERIVGAEVFGRPADYDLSADPVVRVAAGDMRKRLAQYYMQEGRSDRLRFDLPRGSYILQISRAESTAVPASGLSPIPEQSSGGIPPIDTTEPAPEVPLPALLSQSVVALPVPIDLSHARSRRVGNGTWLATAIVAVGFSVFFYLMWANSSARQLEQFWAPVLSGSSTLVCVGDLNFIMTPGEDSDSLSLDRRMQIRDHVGPNDVLALTRIASFLGSQKKTSPVLLADNATLTDLRSQPAVLIGASDNRWTSNTLEGQRFQFKRNGTPQTSEIIDTKHPEKHDWMISFTVPLKDIHRDYALVARSPNSVTGQTEMVVAGIGPYGTAAASEFVTNPEYFEQFTKRVADWHGKSIEIVLSTEVIDGRSGPPHVEMVEVH